MSLGLPCSLLNRPPCPLSGPPVCIDHNVDSVRRCSIVILQNLSDHLGNRGPGDNGLEKCCHGNLVCGIQPGGGGSSGSSGLVGQAEAGEGVEVGCFEVEAAGFRPI